MDRASQDIQLPPLSRAEWLCEAVTFLAWSGSMLAYLVAREGLPETIPTHFDGAGVANGWGGKDALLLVPVMLLVPLLLVTAVSRLPAVWNIPGPVTSENVRSKLLLTRGMLQAVRLCLGVTALLLELLWISAARSGGELAGGSWFSVGVVVSVLGVVLVYFLKLRRLDAV